MPDALFAAPRRRRGPVEAAAERVLTRWRATSEVDELTSAILRGMAKGVDDAERDHRDDRSSAYSVQRCRAELLAAYRTLAPLADAGTDALAELFALPTSTDDPEPARDPAQP